MKSLWSVSAVLVVALGACGGETDKNPGLDAGRSDSGGADASSAVDGAIPDGSTGGADATAADAGPVPEPEARQWSAEIGPEGGTLEIPGALRLEIPSGALSEPTTITAVPTATRAHAPLANLTTAIRFSPDGLSFSTPVRLTFSVTAAPEGAQIVTTPDGGGKTTSLTTTRSDDELSADVSHFSEYFAVYQPPVVVPTSGTCVGTTTPVIYDQFIGALSQGWRTAFPIAAADGFRVAYATSVDSLANVYVDNRNGEGVLSVATKSTSNVIHSINGAVVARGSDGNLLAVYESNDGGSAIWAQKTTDTGVAIGTPFRVSAASDPLLDTDAAVVATSLGYVVAWKANSAPGFCLKAVGIAADLSVGDIFDLTECTSSSTLDRPSLAASADGTRVAVLHSEASISGQKLVSQVLDARGAPLFAPVDVTPVAAVSSIGHSAATHPVGVLVAWNEGHGDYIHLRQLNLTTGLLGVELITTSLAGENPSITNDGAGWAIGYLSAGSAAIARVDASLVLREAPFPLQTVTGAYAGGVPFFTAASGEDYVVTWLVETSPTPSERHLVAHAAFEHCAK